MKHLMLLAMPFLLALKLLTPSGTDEKNVSGKVVDSENKAIAGATVIITAAQNGVTTDKEGVFKLPVNKLPVLVTVSAVGYTTKTVKIANSINNIIQLEAAAGTLQEVVVLGYRTTHKKAVTGSSTVVNARSEAVAPMPPGYYNFRQADAQESFTRTRDMPVVDFNTEGYDGIKENTFLKAVDNPLSTFSIDVDAASYSNVRRFLNQGTLPPAGAVRIEEMINYFSYNYPQPAADKPFSINTEIGTAPWNNQHKLIMVGLQGKKIPTDNLPASNLVFLIDVSGSMSMPNKLPLVKSSLKLLVDQLREQDKVAIVVYAGAAGMVLPATPGSDKQKILDALNRLEAGGSTAGGAGIKLAYKIAQENLVKNGNNRVILCSDGDFNVGESSDDAMERLIEKEREKGVFLTVLGYGMGNYKDNKMQKLAGKGNGNHAYIDGISEAKKVLVNEFGGTLFTIAKDVKLQLEFNPALVQAYRLIGYENRMLAKEDFNDDKKDAGELGSNHTVTAIYEIIPAGVKSSFVKEVDPLKYSPNPDVKLNSGTNEWLTVKFRYKEPDGATSKLLTHVVPFNKPAAGSENFEFATAVAQFGMLLRNSEFKSNASYKSVLELARKAKGKDNEGYRAEFIKLVEVAELLGNTARVE